MIQRTKSQSPGTVYRIKVTLKGSMPPIWRKLEIAGNTTLQKLHRIIQVAMGWTDSHLHQFIIKKEYYSHPDFELDVLDERKAKLDKVIRTQKSKFIYEYETPGA